MIIPKLHRQGARRGTDCSGGYRLLCAILASIQILLPTLAAALPTDGQVTGGQATIQQTNPTTLTIQQATDKAILNWNRFSIAANETVHFVQPSISSIALNRVIGVDPSVILGQLQSNGHIFLINPNGILFGAGAQINVGGLLATTLQIRDDDFMAGRYLFAQDPLKSLKSVVNQGTIHVSDHGFVVLAAPGVSNEGMIVANLGTAILASGKTMTVDLMGDGLINYAISGKVFDQVAGPDGKPLNSAVSNSGTVQADGGKVIMAAKASGDIFSSVVNQRGIVRARSLENQGGVVKLIGGDDSLAVVTAAGAMRPAGEVSGAVVNTGTIDVSAGTPNAVQGSVTMVGERVGQLGSIVATGSESANGGNVVIASSTRTLLASGSAIDVSGIGHSSGGRLRVWSDQETFFDNGATILARGGELGGNGGFIEVSGKENLGFAGTVNALAPFGSAGTLLLDPRNITIATTGGVAYSNGVNNLFGNNIGATTTITPASINGQLANVILQANTDITVTNAIAMTGAGVGISMQAGRSIAVNANMSTNNGNISLIANDSAALVADRAAGAGNITMAGGTTLNAGTGSLSLMIDSSAVGGFTPGIITAQTLAGGAKTITTATGTSIVNGVISGVGGLTKNGVGALTVLGNNTYTGATSINAGTLQLGAANRIPNASALTVTGGATFNLNNFAETIGSLSGAGNITLGTGTLTTGGDNTSTTYLGVMSGTGGLTKAGTGIFTLSGANTYTGATTVNAGTLRVAGGAAIADTSAVTLANVAGTTLDLNDGNETIGSLAGGGAAGGNVTLGAGTLTTGVATNTIYTGILSGSGGLTKQGTGIFTLSGANTYTGATTVNAGTLRLGAANRIADASAVTVAGGATVNLNNFGETIGSLAGAGNVTLGTGTLTAGGDNSSTTFSGVMSGTGGMIKAGTGIFTLSGANTYTGATAINAGTLQLGAVDRIANTSAVTVAGGATFNLNDFSETIGSLAGAGNVTLGAGILTTGGNNTSTTYSGVMSGTGGLTKTGTGIFTLSGANTYIGATTINAGTLRLAGGTALADTSAVTLANVAGATLDLNGTNETIGSLAGGGATGGNVTLGAGTLTTGGNSTSTTYNGVISGTGGMTKAGVGVFTLSRANTYSGVTSVSAGTLVAAVNNALGTVAGGTTVANGATLGFSGGINYATAEPVTLNSGATLSNLVGNNIFAGPITLAGGSETISIVAGTTLTANGIISGAGALAKDGSGMLIYGGANTYTGATTVNVGTLQLGAANLIANTSAVTINAGAIFNLNNFAETIGSLAGAGNITLGTGTLTTGGDNSSTTFSGVMSGTGGLTKQGTGTFTLSGNNTYSGVTNVNSGTLVAAVNNALGTAAGGTVVAAGATLGLSGGINYSTIEPVTLNGGTFANLAGNNSFAGPITLAANSAVTVADGTTMTVGGTVNGGSQLTMTSGTGAINFLSAIGGTTPLSSLTATVGSLSLGSVTTVGAQTYTGTTTLNGNMTTTNSAITLNSPVTLVANTILSAGVGSVTFGNTVDGAFTLAVNSTGMTTFNGVVGNSTALASLTTNAGGTTAFNGGSARTSGNQTYNDNVAMNQATTLASTSGAVTFGGNATNNAAGATLTVDAPTINLTGGTTVATTGNGSINFFTDTLNPNGGSINVGTAAFALSPNTLTNTIEFGDINFGRVTDVYYGSNFGSVIAGSFTIGRPTHTGNIFVTGVAAAPTAISVVNGGAGSVIFENAPYVSGNQDLSVVSGSSGITMDSNLTIGAGTLRLTTSGAITQTSGAITANITGLSAGTGITLAQSANNVTTLAAQTTVGNISFTDTDGFNIGSVNATGDGFHPAIAGLTATAGTITVQSGGLVTQVQRILASSLSLQGSGPYQLTNSANDVTSLSANTTGNIQYNDATTLVFGVSNITGSLDVTTGGAITQIGAVAVTGTTTLAAGTANDITLTNVGNDFSTVGIASGNNVTLNDINELTLGTSTVSGTLSVTTGGVLTQSGAVTVVGATTLAAGANDISLTNAGNDFSTVSITNGNNVALTDASALNLGASTIDGNLSLTTGGMLSQNGALAVAGSTSFSATAANTDILLNTQPNNFVGGLSFAGAQSNFRDIALRNLNAGATVPTLAGLTNLRNLTLTFDNAPMVLPTLTASGNVAATAGGLISQSSALIVAGIVTLTAGANDITLSNAGNDFSTVGITSGNNVSLADNSALSLGASTVIGNLNVATGGALTQSGAVTVVGITTLAAGANDITLTNTGNDFSMVGITSGDNVSLADNSALSFGASTVGGTFNVTTGGALTQSGAITVAGTTTLATGANDITLTNAGNNFSTVGIVSGNHVALTDANAMTMNPSSMAGNFSANGGDLTIGGPVVSTGGSLNLTGVNTVTQSANLTANGANSVTVTTTTGSIMMAGAATSSSGTGTITYTAGTDVTLGSLGTGGAVNIIANGGSIFSAVGSGTNVTAGANSTLQAFNGVVGTSTAPLTVNINPGTLSLRAATTVSGISAFLTGTVLPSNALTLLNIPPGLVCFNGCPVVASNNPFANFGFIPSFNRDSAIPWYLHQPSDPPLVSILSTYVPGTVVAEAATDVTSSNQSIAREIPPCYPESACTPGASILTTPADGEDPELSSAK